MRCPRSIGLALLCWLLFACATLSGLRKYVCVLSLTPPGGDAIGVLDIIFMVVYVLLYALSTTVAPILVIAVGLEKALVLLRRGSR